MFTLRGQLPLRRPLPQLPCDPPRTNNVTLAFWAIPPHGTPSATRTSCTAYSTHTSGNQPAHSNQAEQQQGSPAHSNQGNHSVAAQRISPEKQHGKPKALAHSNRSLWACKVAGPGSGRLGAQQPQACQSAVAEVPEHDAPPLLAQRLRVLRRSSVRGLVAVGAAHAPGSCPRPILQGPSSGTLPSAIMPSTTSLSSRCMRRRSFHRWTVAFRSSCSRCICALHRILSHLARCSVRQSLTVYVPDLAIK